MMCPGVGRGVQKLESLCTLKFTTLYLADPMGAGIRRDLPRRQWTGAGPQEYLRSKLRAEILADRLHLVDVIGLEGGN